MKMNKNALLCALSMFCMGQAVQAADMVSLRNVVASHYGKVLLGVGVLGALGATACAYRMYKYSKNECLKRELAQIVDLSVVGLNDDSKCMQDLKVQWKSKWDEIVKADNDPGFELLDDARIIKRSLIGLGWYQKDENIDEVISLKKSIQERIKVLSGGEIIRKDDTSLTEVCVVQKWTQEFKGINELIKQFERYSKQESLRLAKLLEAGIRHHFELLEAKAQLICLDEQSKLARWGMVGIISCLMQGAISCKKFEGEKQLWSPEYNLSFELIEQFERYDKERALSLYEELDAGRCLQYLAINGGNGVCKEFIKLFDKLKQCKTVTGKQLCQKIQLIEDELFQKRKKEQSAPEKKFKTGGAVFGSCQKIFKKIINGYQE